MRKGRKREDRGRSTGERRPTLQSVGTRLMEDISGIVDELGPGNPQLRGRLLQYIEEIDSHHPEWGAVMRRTRQKRTRSMGRKKRAG